MMSGVQGMWEDNVGFDCEALLGRSYQLESYLNNSTGGDAQCWRKQDSMVFSQCL